MLPKMTCSSLSELEIQKSFVSRHTMFCVGERGLA
jgi:hypothetical protein